MSNPERFSWPSDQIVLGLKKPLFRRKTWKGGWATRRRLGGDLGFLAHRPLPFLAFDLLSEEVLTH